MKGYLKIFVLRELAGRDFSGYDLMKGFGRFTGTKMPSPGTVYPLLNDLLDKKLIDFVKKGNSKIYGITKKGALFLKELMEERKKALDNILPIFRKVYSRRELEDLHHHLLAIHGGRHNRPDVDVLHALKDSVICFLTGKSYKNRRQDFRKVILDTAKKIRGLS
jgi:DNA-binding PadR family transcriptional regulator